MELASRKWLFALRISRSRMRFSRQIIASCLLLAGAFGSWPSDANAQRRLLNVRVPVEGAELAGRLYKPGGKRPATAVVLLAGSQNSRNLPSLAEHLVSQGIVVLELEKRGVRSSTGTWWTETIEERAADALAAINFLRSQGGVNSKKIGLIGHSQGGWVALHAAAQSSAVAHVVLLAGPAQTVKQQMLTDERNHLAGWGVPPDEVQSRVEMFDQLLGAAFSNPAVCGPKPRHYLCGIIGYDPAPALARVRVPVLAIYGEKDPMTPPEPNRRLLTEALQASGNQSLQTIVMPGANHQFRKAVTGLRDEYPRLEQSYVPGFLNTISEWLRRQ